MTTLELIMFSLSSADFVIFLNTLPDYLRNFLIKTYSCGCLVILLIEGGLL